MSEPVRDDAAPLHGDEVAEVTDGANGADESEPRQGYGQHFQRVEPSVERPVESFAVRHHRPIWLTWLVIILVVGLVVAGVGVFWVRRQISPGGRPGVAVPVSIPPGSSSSHIASLLGHAGVIHSPTVFRFYVKVKGAGPLLAGAYTLHKNSKYDDVIATLEKGPAVTLQRFTIPEGFTLAEIAARVGKLPGRSAARFLTAATSGAVHSRFQPPGSNSLEGLLFPATYDVRPDEDEVSILRRMADAFDQQATAAGIDQAAATLRVTPYQVVTVASMVEREAKLDEDRGPIASVIYNRIRKGMPLQVDATLLYGEHLTDAHQLDLKADTPYNTYKYKGLPPTPIASPGLPSLQAASAPPTTPYLYYVLIDPSGKHGFAVTSTDFAKLQAEAR
ncbi:MAG TPA: endolytic transglycosylase MltG, partial [Acidimicrobiales bacterium]|nr:endolytic transglycosylase MltG [Acidimicrobiales bacterium]